MKSKKNMQVVLTLAIIFTIQHANSEIDVKKSEIDYNLPEEILPISYNIALELPVNDLDIIFNGTVKINASVSVATKEIVFHAEDITMNKIIVISAETELIIVNSTYDSVTKKQRIELNEELPQGKLISLVITYKGILRNDLTGFYKNLYTDDNGEKIWLFNTHLEPVSARKVFPCFDEPALKATFQISVNRPANYIALSNTPLKSSTEPVNGRIWDTFEETPLMSTYLVALVVVSDYKSLNDPKNNYSTWAKPSAVHETKYALSLMAPLTQYFEKSYNHAYDLTKLDMISVPTFQSVAMENWGLVVFREGRMMYNEKSSTIEDKQKVALTTAHEIAHQWFGNLVSPSSWQYLWLSEGFCNYLEYLALAQVETKWGCESQYVIDEQHLAFNFDGYSYSRSMNDVFSPSQPDKVDYGITYTKAGSILRMMEKSFGSTLFYNALSDYVESRKFSYATPEHLFKAFQNQVISSEMKLEASVKTIMESWTMQPGYPVLLVTISDNIAKLHQERFLLANSTKTSIDKTWWIPITWASESNSDFSSTIPKYWLNETNGSIPLNSSNEWIIFNVQQSGFYRVNYDPDSWYRIINILKSQDFEQIHEINRAAIIDDLLNLARNGYVDYGITLSATQYFRNETNYIPWQPIFNSITFINKWIKGTDTYEMFKIHMRTIISSTFEYLGIEEKTSDSHYDKLLRSYIVKWACYYDLASCISQSSQIFANWKQKLSLPVPINLHTTVYCAAIKNGSSDDWQFLWNQFLATNVSTEKSAMLNGLGCSNKAEVIQKLLMKAITNDSEIPFEHSEQLVISVITDNLNPEAAMDFMGQNYPQMAAYYRIRAPLGHIAMAIAYHLTTEKPIPKHFEIIEKHKINLTPILKYLEYGVSYMRDQHKWYNAQGLKIFNWLNNTYGLP